RADRAHEQRVAVRRRFRGHDGCDGAAAARAIVDHDLLAETLGKFLPQRARNDVRHAAWCKADDKTNGFVWIRGGLLRRRAHKPGGTGGLPASSSPRTALLR